MNVALRVCVVGVRRDGVVVLRVAVVVGRRGLRRAATGPEGMRPIATGCEG